MAHLGSAIIAPNSCATISLFARLSFDALVFLLSYAQPTARGFRFVWLAVARTPRKTAGCRTSRVAFRFEGTPDTCGWRCAYAPLPPLPGCQQRATTPILPVAY